MPVWCATAGRTTLGASSQSLALRRVVPEKVPDRRLGVAVQLGVGTGNAYRMIRELVPFTHGDGTLPADLEPLVELLSRGDLTVVA